MSTAGMPEDRLLEEREDRLLATVQVPFGFNATNVGGGNSFRPRLG
jgi:hypothetical protein